MLSSMTPLRYMHLMLGLQVALFRSRDVVS